MKLNRSVIVTSATAVMGACPFASLARPVWDAASDFSATSNPNRDWSFGYQYPSLGVGFTLETTSGNYLGVDYWSAAAGLPGAYHNPSSATNVNYGTAIFDPGMLILHPGPIGEYSLARFTAPAAGSYQFNITFIGQDQAGGTTSDVHVLVNSSPVFNGLINGFHVTATTGTVTVPLAMGDTIDAAVGWGTNGNYYCDSTGLIFNVIPAPGTAALIGLGGLFAARRRRG